MNFRAQMFIPVFQEKRGKHCFSTCFCSYYSHLIRPRPQSKFWNAATKKNTWPANSGWSSIGLVSGHAAFKVRVFSCSFASVLCFCWGPTHAGRIDIH